ncbi:MAG: hypothetical protein WA082_00985 [Candidatus Moraniibacteriota bacterium]
MEQMEYIQPQGISSRKTSILKYLGILLYAIAGSLVITIIGDVIFRSVVVRNHFFALPFLFGIIATIPILFYFGRRSFLIKWKILSFIIFCTFSQWVALIFGMMFYLSLGLLGAIFLGTIKIMMTIPFIKSMIDVIHFLPILLIPSVVGAGIILLSQKILFFETVARKKSEFVLILAYSFFFPILLSFFIDISSFSNLAAFGGEQNVDVQAFLSVTFFWQVGMLYFLTERFSRLTIPASN